MQRILNYLQSGVSSRTLQTIGAEVETQFVTSKATPISIKQSQQTLGYLLDGKWEVETSKSNLITTITDEKSNRISFELGRHNFEVATSPCDSKTIVSHTQGILNQLYEAANKVGVKPLFAPMLQTTEDTLIIPDKRDAIWVELDGREALKPLGVISSVQFTFSVAPNEAIEILNRLGKNINKFLLDYPQDSVWRKYVQSSLAGYKESRYGGPLLFDSVNDYSSEIASHSVVMGTSLVPVQQVKDLDVDLHLRSVWWHFRLKRYGKSLCIEVRPMARRNDENISRQLQMVLDIVS